MNLDLLDSATHIDVSPRFDELHHVIMVITLYRDTTQIAPGYRMDFAECSHLLQQIRARGFRTAYVDESGMALYRIA